jgi:hypothetical protein
MGTEHFDAFMDKVRRGPEFGDNLEAMIRNTHNMRKFRESSVTAKTIKEDNKLELLSLLVQAWPAADIRTTDSYREYDRVLDTSDTFITDVAEGLTLRENTRSARYSSVVLDIMLQSNLDEFEEYNEEVSEHNSEWIDRGSQEYAFDPVTGEEKRHKDTYVDTVKPSSVHHQHLKNGASSGDLTKKAPKQKQVPYGSIEYRISNNNTLYTIGFVVYSKEGTLLYYNEIKGKDISLLVRRATQEIWGNHQILDQVGDFYDGISQLFKGHKIKTCRDMKNTKPKWCTTSKVKNPTSVSG